ncbi:hypothetical protein JCM6882_008510 [Rhodosporidiobolus microsporus]
MDKFGSAKGAFAQARALAESGRSQVTKQFDKIDSRYPMGGQKAGGGAGTPTDERPSSSSGVSAPPPPPPSRFGAGSSGPPPPPGRGRSSSGVGASSAAAAATGGGAGVFVNMSVTEKEAFFALLDEYFSSRPHLAHLFQSTNSAPPPVAAPAAPAASRPAPPPARRGLGTAVALYDFEAGQAEDLSFREGDRIEVLEVVSDDWYRGALHGREGIFPSAYVQMEG